MKRIFLTSLILGAIVASCDKYDDSAIKESLTQLEDRVTALESLRQDVTVLKDIVGGLVTVTSCDEKDGIYNVTLSDGSVIKVHAGMTELPVITVFTENGRTYWGYYQGGEVQPLLYKDEKVEVTSVTPAMKFNDEGKLEISVDGGRTWVVSEGKISGGIFSDLIQDDGYLTLVLADGFTEVTIPVEENRQMTFMVCTGKQYFKASETKTVPVEMIGVDRYTITETPQGWSATLDNGVMTVTAPAANQGAKEGYIKMIGVGSQTDIAQVYVAIGTAPCIITIDETNKVTYKPNPQSCFYGACLIEEFDPKTIARNVSGVTNPMLCPYPFTSSKTSMPFTDLVSEVIEGETYIVWAMPATGEACYETDILYQAVTSIGVNYEVSNVTFDDARISVDVKGADKYYLVYMQEDMTVDNVIEDLNGNYASTYDRYLHVSSAKIRVSDIVDSPISGREYRFLVLPVKMGQFQAAASKEFTVKLNDFIKGGSCAVALETASVDFKEISVNVTSADAYKCYLSCVAKADYESNGYSDDDTLLDYLSTLSGTLYTSPYTYTARNLDSGAEYYVVGVAVDRNGIAGAPVRLEVVTKAVVYLDSVVEAAVAEASLSTARIVVNSTSNIVKYRYMFLAGNGSDYWYYTYVDDDAAAESALIYGSATYVEVDAAAAAAGIAFSDLTFGVKYIFRVVGYDKDGNVTHLGKVDVDPTVGAVIKFSDALWSANKPDVRAVAANNSMQLSVTFPKGCMRYVVTKMSSEEYTTAMPSNARGKTDYVLSHGYAETFYENLSNYVPSSWYIGSDMPYILIAWEDQNGWYEPMVVDSATGEILNK